MLNKMLSTAYLNPAGANRKHLNKSRFDLYKDERNLMKETFKSFGRNIDWSDPSVNKALRDFASNVIKKTKKFVVEYPNLIEEVLPVETLDPGETFVLREIHGVNVYYGTYGASVRMSRPQFTEYTQKTNLKEAGIKLNLGQVRAGKYSPSELADYTSNLITVWRNYLLFTTTLAGMTAYQSGGAQYQSGASFAFGTMDAAYNKLSDESEVKAIVGRRQAIHALSNANGWSDESKNEFHATGQVGSYAGTPVLKVNSFTDPDYGTVYPMPADELWIFSELPAGEMVVADQLRSSDETILRNETMNIYFRWDDGIGIHKTARIVRVASIT